MALSTRHEGVKAFLDLFRQTARERHRFEVFKDFVTLSACSLHNACLMNEDREKEYLGIIGKYKPDDQQRFPQLFALLVGLLEPEPRDILGQLYMELELGSKDNGQFFTPPEVSELMAHMIDIDPVKQDRDFVTLSEPACGAGGMVLAYVGLLIAKGYNPGTCLWAQCVDIDRTSALMCYIQLALWNVPAEVIVGNTLSLDYREQWYTPRHVLGSWSAKLARHWASPRRCANEPAQALQSANVTVDVEIGSVREQLGFGF